MPTNTRATRARELLERLQRGPSFPTFGPEGDTPESAARANTRYRLWASSWVLDELVDLVPELRGVKLEPRTLEPRATVTSVTSGGTTAAAHTPLELGERLAAADRGGDVDPLEKRHARLRELVDASIVARNACAPVDLVAALSDARRNLHFIYGVNAPREAIDKAEAQAAEAMANFREAGFSLK